MKKKRWLIVAIFVIVVATAAAGAYLWFGRSKPAAVHYLTTRVTKGTISQTVTADFTLSSANGATSVALGGGAAGSSTSSASSVGASTGTTSAASRQATSNLASGTTLASGHPSGGAAATTFTVLSAATSATAREVSAALPTVTAVSPGSGSTAGGTSVTVIGTGFSTSAPTVEFGANAATGVSVSSDTSLTCTSPAGSVGTVDVTVTTTAGSSATSDADHFTYQAPASPTPTPTMTAHPSSSPTATGSSSSGSFSRSGSSGSPGSYGGTGSSSSVTSTSTGSSGSSTFSGVVTRLVRPAGAKPQTLQRLLYVSGKPVFAFVSPTPLWKNLSTSLASGSQRANVAALQKALKQQGYYKKAINGDFTSATETAFKHWQKANGLSQTGVLDITRFVWMPKGSVLTSWSVGLGSHVSSGTALASVVSPSRLSATAAISQADIAELKVGQKTRMAIDGYTSDSFTGRISFISSEPVSSSSASGSSSSTQYSITVTPQGLPSLAKSGMTGTLTIVIAQRSNVLIVPTSAVSGTSSTSFVRVMQDGKPVFRQVQTGMATSSYTQITSGLAEGETVITGQYSDGATSTGTGTSTPGGLFRRSSGGGFSGGFPGGGFRAPGGGQ